LRGTEVGDADEHLLKFKNAKVLRDRMIVDALKVPPKTGELTSVDRKRIGTSRSFTSGTSGGAP